MTCVNFEERNTEEIEVISLKDVKEKTPELEQFLMEVAKAAGATEVVMFDGSIKLLNKTPIEGENA